jgi:hypothetical protein
MRVPTCLLVKVWGAACFGVLISIVGRLGTEVDLVEARLEEGFGVREVNADEEWKA